MFVSGKILSQTAGHGDHRGKACPCSCGTSAEGIAVIADGVDAVRLAVRENLRKGVDQIKIMAGGGVSSPGDELAYPQYSMDELTAISDEAGRFGRYVMSHVYADLGIRRAVEGGVRSIEHGNFLTSDTAKLMRDREACLVPTLVTYVADAKYGKSFGWSDENDRKNGEITLLTRAVLCGTHDACRLACDSFARKLFRGLRARSLREARAGARLRASCALARTGATRGASRAFRRRGRSCRGWRRNWG